MKVENNPVRINGSTPEDLSSDQQKSLNERLVLTKKRLKSFLAYPENDSIYFIS
jgi:hypothetical protein